MRVHFLHQHVLNTVVILEEGNPSHPRCARCDMLVPWQDLNGRHPAMAQYVQGSRAEEAAACGGGDKGELGAGL